eukprot:COSAG05_NODE_1778_length_4099_cov_2.396000_1_plen_958_part_00
MALGMLFGLAPIEASDSLPSSLPQQPGGLWDWSGRGDVRAVVTVSAGMMEEAAAGPVAAVVEWRRRDTDLSKAVIVTDSAGHVLTNISTPVMEQHSGIVVFTPGSAGTYYVYYMPYTQSGIGHANMKWVAGGGGGGDWESAGSFEGKAAVHTRQDFVLPHPISARKFRWSCLRGWGSDPAWQAFLVELNFRTVQGGWLPNNATSANPAPVTGASSWQPSGGSSGGQPWQAMDGDTRTLWDPRGSPAWLAVEFDQPQAVDAFGILSYGTCGNLAGRARALSISLSLSSRNPPLSPSLCFSRLPWLRRSRARLHPCGPWLPYDAGDTTHDIHLHKLEYQPLANHSQPVKPWQQLPSIPAASIRIEFRDAFHNLDPMGQPANATEVASLLTRFSADATQRGYLLFPEPRENKVMMEERVPYSWVERGPSANFSAEVTRGEWFYFQLGLLATANLSAVTITPFVLTDGSTSVETQCLNTEGSTSLGEDVSPARRPRTPGFTSFEVRDLRAGAVRALWIGLQIPASLAPGTILRGSAELTVSVAMAGSGSADSGATTLGATAPSSMSSSQTVTAALTVSAKPVSTSHGYDDLQSYARLNWLNSKLAIDDEVVAPYTPLQLAGGEEGRAAGGSEARTPLVVSLLNRRVTLGASGLPSAVTVTRPASAHGVIAAREIHLLAKPVSLAFISSSSGGGAGGDGGRAPLPLTVVKPATVVKHSAATVGWTAEFVAGPAHVVLNGTIHMDGYIDFVFELSRAASASAASSFTLSDIQLLIEWLPQPRETLMLAGMGVVSGALEPNASVAWKWSTAHRNNFMWAGTASAGLKVQLKDDNDPHRDAAIKSYTVLPLTWDNGGRGGANITALSTTTSSTGGKAAAPADLGASFTAFTGEYTLSPAVPPPATSGSRVFRFDLSVTPFKPRNESQHWGLRHFQVGYPSASFTSAEDVAKTGATVVNIHQGEPA